MVQDVATSLAVPLDCLGGPAQLNRRALMPEFYALSMATRYSLSACCCKNGSRMLQEFFLFFGFGHYKMLHIVHKVSSVTWHFLWCVCVCVCEQVKEDVYKLAELSPSVQRLMMERFKSPLCKSHRDMQSRPGNSFRTQIQNQADDYHNTFKGSQIRRI